MKEKDKDQEKTCPKCDTKLVCKHCGNIGSCECFQAGCDIVVGKAGKHCPSCGHFEMEEVDG